jgi:hypothetical protein
MQPAARRIAVSITFTAVGWRALVELASQATPEPVRLELEARVIAGERVTGAEIIRARSSA